MMKKAALGKGLSALIPDSYTNIINEQKKTEQDASDAGIISINIDAINPNQDQPRNRFEDNALNELADSIKEKGIIQPIIVKKIGETGRYEIVCGERRARAAEKAGVKSIPAIVKDIATDSLLELALVENIQREDLNPIELAKAFTKLQERRLSPEEIAKKVGRDRSTIVNTVRLLKLPEEVLQLITEKKVSEGHARALLGLPTHEYQRKMAKRIVEESLSVRQVEAIVKRKAYQKRSAKQLRKIDAQIIDLERKLEDKMGSKVRIFAGKRKGRIEIKYFSLDELDRILSLLGIAVD